MAQEALTEKVSVNMNTSVLASVDLLVDHGYYSNRSDFINQAVRAALQQNQPILDRVIHQHTDQAGPAKRWFVGVYLLDEAEVDRLCAAGETVAVSGYGVLVIDGKIDPARLYAAVSQIQVKGKVSCSEAIRAHYGLPGKGRKQ